MTLYTAAHLQFQNPTYRNPERLFNTARRLSDHLKENKALSRPTTLQGVRGVFNHDMRFVSENDKPQRSFLRKKSEVKKLGFHTISPSGAVVEHLDIEHLNPQQNTMLDPHKEWKSNVLMYALAKGGQLRFMYETIQELNAQWKDNGNRQGVLEWELIYLKGYLTQNSQSSAQDLAREVIALRRDFKAHHTGPEKQFWHNKIEALYGKKFLQSTKDYIDSLMRSFSLTQCFTIKRHSKDQNDKFAMRILQINPGFRDKIQFFLDTPLERQNALIKNKMFCRTLYKSFDARRAYENENKLLNDVVRTDPYAYEVDAQLYVKSTNTWFGHEFDTSLLALQAIKKCDARNYNRYAKNVAIKMDNGVAYAGTTSGVADCYVVMRDVVATFEATTLRDGFQQCNKEYIPNKSHLDKLMSEHEKTLGVSVFVAPNVSASIVREFLINNYAQPLMSQKSWLVAFNKTEYCEFLTHVNSNSSFKKYADALSQIDTKAYLNGKEGNPFYEALLVFVEQNKKSQ